MEREMSVSESVKGHRLTGIIDEVRRRRNLLTWLRGIALTVATVALTILITGLAAYRYRYSPWTVNALRLFAVTIIASLAYVLLWRPLRRKVTTRQLARLIEECVPGIDDRFVTAIEALEELNNRAIPPSERSIIDRLLDDADKHATGIDRDLVVPKKRILSWAAAAIAALLCFVGVILHGPREVRVGVAELVAPASSVAASNALRIEVKPEGGRVARGTDQRIVARLINFSATEVTFYYRRAGSGDDQWIGQPMEPGRKAEDFQYQLFNLQNDTEYFIEAPGCRSEVFRLTVVDRPLVKRIDQRQVFPAYTGLGEKQLEDAPEISVPAGTSVTLRAILSGPARSATIVLASGSRIEMERGADNTFSGTIEVSAETTYHIELTSIDGETYNGSNEYDILILADRPPVVTFEKPGRDARATSVEEIFTLAKAEDDYGVTSLDLHFSINGGEEKKIDLQKVRGESQRSLAGSHTFFLEEYGLVAGDLVSYYARARDARNETTSDIYFIEIKPFEKDFKQSQQNGSGPAGSGEQPQALTKRQKDIVAATFRINREETGYDEKQKSENYDTVALAQEKLKADAIEVVDRIKRRLGSQIGQQKDFARLVELITQATKEMEPAATGLRGRQSVVALPPEQRALQQLMRADAVFREVQVSMEQSSGGGGQSQAQDLADLFELELDKMKNQYETLQREQQSQGQQQEDEAKRKLDELSKRMQREIEQQQRQRSAPRNQSASGGGGGGRQQQMIEEARKAARELEKLSRQRRDPQMTDLSNRLNQAADEMERAQSAARNNKEEESISRNLRAMQQIEDAKRRLDQMQQSMRGQSVGELRQRAAEAASRQQEISRQMEQASRSARGGDSTAAGASAGASAGARQELAEKKESLASEVGNLERAGRRRQTSRCRQLPPAEPRRRSDSCLTPTDGDELMGCRPQR